MYKSCTHLQRKLTKFDKKYGVHKKIRHTFQNVSSFNSYFKMKLNINSLFKKRGSNYSDLNILGCKSFFEGIKVLH